MFGAGHLLTLVIITVSNPDIAQNAGAGFDPLACGSG